MFAYNRHSDSNEMAGTDFQHHLVFPYECIVCKAFDKHREPVPGCLFYDGAFCFCMWNLLVWNTVVNRASKVSEKLPSLTRRTTLCGCCVLKLRWREKEERGWGSTVDVCQSPEGMRGVELSCIANTHKEHIIISVLKREFTQKSRFCHRWLALMPSRTRATFSSSVGRGRRRFDGCSRCPCAMKAGRRCRGRSCDMWSSLWSFVRETDKS